MKIKYFFVTGETIEIEVADELGTAIMAIDKTYELRDRTETRRHNSFEGLSDQGIQIADPSADIESSLEQQEWITRLYQALCELQPQQQALVRKVFFEDQSITAAAREEGVDESAIRDRLRKVYRQLKKYL